MSTTCYQIPTSRLDDLKSKVTRLARRARKLGLAPVALLEHKECARTSYRENGRAYELPCTWVELTGPSPVVNGHDFIARVEHTEAGNLVSRVDDGELDLTAYRTAKPVCDHCKSARMRRDTFVLRAPDGTLHQIGRNCLADYLRSGDVEVAIGIMRLVEELSRSASGGDDDGEGGFGGGWVLVIPPSEFVAAAVAAVRQCGWVSSKAATESAMPTRHTARYIAGQPPSDERERRSWLAMQPTKADIERAAKIVEWITASTDTSDYMHNLRVAVAMNGTTRRTEGLLASTVIAYERHVEGIERKRRESEGRVESTYFGEIGKRYEIAGTVERVHYIDGHYGTTTLIVLADAEGHRFKWFATGSKEVETGAAISLKGTVKSHEQYKGAKETVLTRCKLAA